MDPFARAVGNGSEAPVIRDIVAGERDPLVLARNHNRRIKASKDEVTKALTGKWRDEHRFLLKQSLAIFDDLAKRVQECDAKIEALLAPLQRHTVQLKASLKGMGKNNPAFDVRHPRVLGDLLDYNDFLDLADAAVEELDLDGVIQVASFHPDYRFEGEDPGDMGQFSNRSPFPTLHLLREASIERAVPAFPDAAAIYERNIETLRRLGSAGWRALFAQG